MSRKCQISKKGPQSGNNVSHANNKRRKTWNVNLKRKRIFDSQSGQWVSLRVSTRFIRTIDKLGLAGALKKAGLNIQDVR